MDRYTRRSTVYAERGVVATSQPLAAQAGIEVLSDGGNAFDAAVATAAALAVVEPTSTGIGGDAFAIYRTADGAVEGLQACGPAPSRTSIEAVETALADPDPLSGKALAESDADEVHHGGGGGMPFLGPHTVTVPGAVRGWAATLSTHGTRDLATVLEPAIHYATEGFPVTPIVADQWDSAETLFIDDNARTTFLFDGESPEPGQHVRLERLGWTLERIADAGPAVLYEGDIAEEIAKAVQQYGGHLSVDDLAAFEPTIVEPASQRYRGAEIFQLPPPNQGLITLEALGLLETRDPPADPSGPAWRHEQIEATKLALADGHEYITDPTVEPSPPLSDPAYLEERAGAIGTKARHPVEPGSPFAVAEDSDTVLLTVADRAGNVVSFINSRFAGFGSGLVAGDTGIALQNRGASFSLNPAAPNALAPGKRPFHTLAPGLARFGDDDWAALGVMGGYMQPQGQVQVIGNLIDRELGLQAALDAPRWRYRLDGTLAVEEPLAHQTALAERGHEIRVMHPRHFGGGQLTRRAGSVLSGASDPRKDGLAVGY